MGNEENSFFSLLIFIIHFRDSIDMFHRIDFLRILVQKNFVLHHLLLLVFVIHNLKRANPVQQRLLIIFVIQLMNNNNHVFIVLNLNVILPDYFKHNAHEVQPINFNISLPFNNLLLFNDILFHSVQHHFFQQHRIFLAIKEDNSQHMDRFI